MTDKTVFLHVGCRKSGTSALQVGFRRSADALAEHGLGQPFPHRAALQHRLVEPVAHRLDKGRGTPPPALARRIRTSPHPRHLVSLEALAEWEPDATGMVLDALAEFDLRVVVTVRPWAMTIPSEWQQLVKSRYTGGYREYVAALRDPGDASADLAGHAHRFHRRQDVADVARRWGAGDRGVRTHVVLVPPSGTTPGLLDLFCGVLGVDPSLVALPRITVNPSLSYPNAEVLRLVNLALGDRLTDLRGDYRASVRRWIGVHAMMSQDGQRIRLPREHEQWATGQAERQLRELRELGCEVVGDEDAYLRPSLQGEDFVPPTGDELAAAAAEVLAGLATWHDAARREADEVIRDAEEKEQARATPPSVVRRVAGRIARGRAGREG